MYSNCIIYAVKMYRKFGGYILFRRSRWGKFPHLLWMSKDKTEISSFVPDDPKKKLLPPPIFKGHIKKGD